MASPPSLTDSSSFGEYNDFRASSHECSTKIKVTKEPSDIYKHLENCSIDTVFDKIRDSSKTRENFLENAPSVDIYHKEYDIIRQISSGTFGSVHCVRRRDAKGTIEAAKYLKSSGDALHREVNALISLLDSHYILHFVGYYKQTKQDIKSVLVTEYLEGGDLCERTASNTYFLTEHKCRTIMRQIILAVSYIHSRRFVHFDLKPFNIVFAKHVATNNDRDLRIIDFGLARELTKDVTSVNVGMAGSIEYMAPEVMNCLSASYPADMWGIGCIAYQLLSGGLSPFFDNRSRFRTMERVLECNYSLKNVCFRHVSVDALEFISRLLKLNPEERMTADQSLSHSWLQRHFNDDSDAYECRSPSPNRLERHSSVSQYPTSLMTTFLTLPEVKQQDERPINTERSTSLELIDTTWMRRSLARHRWYRVYGFLRAVNRFKSGTFSRKSSHDSKGSSKPSRDSGFSEKDFDQITSYCKSLDKL